MPDDDRVPVNLGGAFARFLDQHGGTMELTPWQQEVVDAILKGDRWKAMVINQPPRTSRVLSLMPVRYDAWMRAAAGEPITWFDVPTAAETARTVFERARRRFLGESTSRWRNV